MQRILIILPVLVLGACANLPEDRVPGGEPSEAPGLQVAAPESDFAAEDTVLYHLLVAELAGARGDLDAAVQHYLSAAERSSDSGVAERAARIAVYAGDNKAARRAAERWTTLSPQAPGADEVLAIIALRTGELEAATNHLQAVIRASSSLAAGFDEVSALLNREVESGKAIDVLQRLTQRYPEQRSAHYALGETALEAGRPRLALTAANDALSLSPDWRDGYLLRAQAYLATGESELGLADLQRLLRQSPEDYDLRLHYARTLLDLSRTQEALTEFQRLMERRPDDPQVTYAAALLAMDAGELEMAREYLLKMVNSGERADAAYYYLGRIAEQEGDYQGAIRWYSRAGGDYRAEAQLRISLVLAESGDLEQARARLQSLREDDPDLAPRTFAMEGEMLRSAGRLEESLAVYNQALAQSPGNTDLLYGRAMTAVSLDRLDLAESDLRQVIDAEPDNAHALNALGYTLVDRTDRVREGKQLIEQAYNIRPDEPAILDSMGWALYRLGEPEQALDYLEKAHERSEEPEIAAHLGEVLWQLGYKDRARSVWQQVLKEDPDNRFVTETMRRLTE
ncbi:tetratricopeptide repeat protein [Ectothiorhodospiraceae bacterium WFHF3C12]|nr:tetratricopeptide repeat protein [Ectothiorhodospiraceae bacterium WFHF3C12]